MLTFETRPRGELLSKGEFAPLAVDRLRERPLSGSASEEADTEELRVRDRPRESLRLSDTERELVGTPEEDVAEPDIGDEQPERPRGDMSGGDNSPVRIIGDSGGERIVIIS